MTTSVRTLLMAALLISATGCRKKAAVAPPAPPPAPVAHESAPPAPPPAKPVISSFEVSPDTIQAGQSARLTWRVSGADAVQITPEVGSVSGQGERDVRPTETTVYTLTASGAGGETRSSVRLTVSRPPAPEPAPSPSIGLTERLARETADIYFGYDRSTLDDTALAAVQKNLEPLRRILSDFPEAEILMEGHCDDRGSAEYNLGLGDRRARVVKEQLELLGLSSPRLRIVSLGKERPQCRDATEECWRLNRRVRFAAGN